MVRVFWNPINDFVMAEIIEEIPEGVTVYAEGHGTCSFTWAMVEEMDAKGLDESSPSRRLLHMHWDDEAEQERVDALGLT